MWWKNDKVPLDFSCFTSTSFMNHDAAQHGRCARSFEEHADTLQTEGHVLHSQSHMVLNLS